MDYNFDNSYLIIMKCFKLHKLLIFLTVLNFSCYKEKTSTNILLNKSKPVDLVIAGNNEKILKFNNSSDLHVTIDQLSEMSDDVRFLWEEQYPGFQSMSKIFNLITNEESKIADSLELDTTRNPYLHTNLINIYPNSIVIKTYEEASFFEKNIAYEPFSWIANKDGAFFIGDTLFVMDENYIRYKINGTVADIMYIRSFMESNVTLGIFVETINNSIIPIFNNSKRTLLK